VSDKEPVSMSEDFDKNEHAIFDKISQSMQYANSYDLGSIDLENRFESFDREMDKEEKEDKQTLVEQKEVEGLGMAFSNDIPLTPKTGGRSIPKDVLEAGDIILSTTDDKEISGNIRKITQSEISHAGIYIGNGNVVESIDSGVIERSLETSMKDDTVTVAFRHEHMTPEKATLVTQYLQEKRMEGAKFDHYAIVRNLPIQIAASICNALDPDLRRKCQNFAGRIFLGTDDNNEFYCSELVFKAFKAADLYLTNIEPQWSSPEDLIKLSYNGTLRYVGHLKTT
jgi:uncharacterized protein YycO